VGPRDPGVEVSFSYRGKGFAARYQVLLLIGALGPVNWTPRTALGWRIDHFLGYFAITLVVCYAWPGRSGWGYPHNRSSTLESRSTKINAPPRLPTAQEVLTPVLALKLPCAGNLQE
jgi:hypothetical protein